MSWLLAVCVGFLWGYAVGALVTSARCAGQLKDMAADCEAARAAAQRLDGERTYLRLTRANGR